VIALAGAAARAGEPVGGALVLTSDYIFRGVSQTDGNPAAQADLHLRSAGGLFAGVWASTTNPPPGDVANREVNVYAGGSWAIAERWAAGLSLVRYLYPDSAAYSRYDATEGAASLRFEDRVALTASVAPHATRYSTRGWAPERQTRAYEASLQQPAFGPVAIVAAVGWYDTRALLGAAYWAADIGVTGRAGPLDLSVLYFGVDGTARRLFGSDAADGRWVFSVAWRF